MIKIRNQIEKEGKVPCGLLVGFLGSGKTTLLNYILQNNTGKKVAVIVNDMSEINIDSQLVQNQIDKRQTEEKLIELQNGCICCTLRLDLLGEIRKLCQDKKLDYIFIEASGMSEPLPIVITFAFEDQTGRTLSDFCYVDNVITMVDIFNIRKNLDDITKVKLTQAINAKQETTKPLAQLLLEQIEFCNTLILNKTDLVKDEGEIQKVVKLCQTLNPEALILRSSYSIVPLEKIMNTGKFDLEKSQNQAGWMKEMQAMIENDLPELHEEYGVWSFHFTSRKPFHPKRFWDYYQSEKWRNIIRSKGYIWIATRNMVMASITKVGQTRELDWEGVWFAAVKPEWVGEEKYKRVKQSLIEKKRWVEPYGDRRQEIIFIGMEMDKEQILKDLESCLLTDQEMKSDWSLLEDPLPQDKLFELVDEQEQEQEQQ